MLALFAILMGLLLGLFLQVSFPPILAPYVGGLLLVLLLQLSLGVVLQGEKKFETTFFLISLFGNLLLSFLLIALGERLQLPLAQAVYLALCYRLFRVLSRLWILWAQKLQARQKQREQDV